MNYALFRLKEDKAQEWKDWCKELDGPLKEAAKETLKEEGASYEAALVFQIEGRWYTMGVSAFFDTPKEADMSKRINIKHREMKKLCLEERLEISKGYEVQG